MTKDKKELRIGIAYSGGVSKCAYQLGFTKTLLKHVDKTQIKALSGASMGFFTAYALSADKLPRLEWIYRKINIAKTWELFWQMSARRLFPKAMDEFFSVNDNLEIPVCIPACYVPVLSTRYYWLKGEYNPVWRKYINGATNFPLLHISPVIRGGRLAFDGGAVDNIPIYPLTGKPFFLWKRDLDLIIALHFDAHYDHRNYFWDGTPILDLDVSAGNNFDKKHFNFSSKYVGEMIKSAEAYAEEICSILFTGDCSKESLENKINQIFLKEHGARRRNASVDKLVSHLNVIGKALRSDSDCHRKLF